MHCNRCGKKCTDDYFILDIKRIKESELFIPTQTDRLNAPLPSIVLCYDCYEKLYNVASGLDL